MGRWWHSIPSSKMGTTGTLPGQLALEEDDEPILVVLSEANVSLLLFKNEKDVPFGLPFVSSALTRTRGAATLERSALLSELTWSDGDNATKVRRRQARRYPWREPFFNCSRSGGAWLD